MISPVTPPQSPLQELIHGPLPTARTVRPANGDVVYGICSLGDGGRVLDKFGFATLDCRPGTRPGLTRLPLECWHDRLRTDTPPSLRVGNSASRIGCGGR